MTQSAVTAAGMKTLRTIAANGGEMNGWAGQRGFNVASARKLVQDGYLTSVPRCAGCADDPNGATVWDRVGKCATPLKGQRNGDECYGRVRITDAGRAAIA